MRLFAKKESIAIRQASKSVAQVLLARQSAAIKEADEFLTERFRRPQTASREVGLGKIAALPHPAGAEGAGLRDLGYNESQVDLLLLMFKDLSPFTLQGLASAGKSKWLKEELRSNPDA